MSESFNQSLYDASVKALTDNGVPEDLAEKASQVVASDDPTQENLGRSGFRPRNYQRSNELLLAAPKGE